VNAWEVYEADLGWGSHPVVIVSHPARAARKGFVKILDCSSQRASRSVHDHEVLLDSSDGLDWPTFCKCDCIYAVPRTELGRARGVATLARRRQIIRTVIAAHGWNAL
jgi:mRNA-degrading endonuclease toxin of MazEF toxin-antitoxin module